MPSAPNLFWALGKHAALGYSPFGIEDLPEDHPLGKAYEQLRGMIPVLTKYQAEGKVMPVMETGEGPQNVSFGGYQMAIRFGGGRGPGGGAPPPQPPPGQSPPANYALIVNTAADEFLFLGSPLSVTFTPDSAGPKNAAIGTVDEGRYDAGKWIPGRRLNGDETASGNRLVLRNPNLAVRIRLYRHD